MPHCTDPYIDDPSFRDPFLVDRHGRPISGLRSNSSMQAMGWGLAILAGAALVLVGLGFGLFGWEFSKSGPNFADSAPSTIGQGK